MKTFLAFVLLGFGIMQATAVSFVTFANFNVTEMTDPSDLTLGSDGFFYGTSRTGGDNGFGAVFKVTTNGSVTILYSFKQDDTNGYFPNGGLAEAAHGDFLGTTSGGGGGLSAFGTVFKITKAGVLTTLHTFNIFENDGATPHCGLVISKSNELYGTTSGEFSFTGAGTVFKITTNGTLTTLHMFSGGDDGAHPIASVTEGSDGNFYGTTTEGGGSNNIGMIYRIGPGGFEALASFNEGGSARENTPSALTEGNDGAFYGVIRDGGTIGAGRIFRVTTNGFLTSFISFVNTNSPDLYPDTYPNGALPSSALVKGSDGDLFGTTMLGGGAGRWAFGTVFKVSTNGLITTLVRFDAINGKEPAQKLVFGPDGAIYGTTQNGGAAPGGYSATMFRLGMEDAAQPTIHSLTRSGEDFILEWDAVVGAEYEVHRTEELNSSNWDKFFYIGVATNAIMSVYDFAGWERMFYRVIRVP